MDLSIIIVNYKSKDSTDTCIKSIYQNTDNSSFEIIVVDNNSDDGCINMLKEKYPSVNGYQNNKNSGFASGSNIGIKMSGGRYILLLHPDTVIHQKALDKMVKFMDSNSHVGIAGCRVENPDGTVQPASRRSISPPMQALLRLLGIRRLLPKKRGVPHKYKYSDIRENRQIDVDAVSSAFLMFRSEVLEDVGGLDENYLIYGVDLDFCYKVRSKRWKVKYYPEARITHFKGHSSKHQSMKATKAFYDSMAIFFCRNIEKKTFFPMRFLVYFIIWFLKQIAIFKEMIKNKRNRQHK